MQMKQIKKCKINQVKFKIIKLLTLNNHPPNKIMLIYMMIINKY